MPLFLLLGLFVGAFGTMIGAGGGFILVPALLLLFPEVKPEVITATSLAVVFANAASGSIAYGRKRKIDYRSGLLFALIGLPGVLVGTLLTRLISRSTFDPIFGLLMAALGTYLLFRKVTADHSFTRLPLTTERSLTDSTGKTVVYRFNLWLGLLISAFVGLLSSFLGIGGGIIHVPALVFLLNFPPTIAAATSLFILMLMSGAATIDHAIHGGLAPGLEFILWLTPGMILGGQLGGWLAHKLHGNWVIKALGIALVLVSLRFLWPR